MPAKKKANASSIDQPRKYNFVLNSYPDERLSRCPYCAQKTAYPAKTISEQVWGKLAMFAND